MQLNTFTKVWDFCDNFLSSNVFIRFGREFLSNLYFHPFIFFMDAIPNPFLHLCVFCLNHCVSRISFTHIGNVLFCYYLH